MHFEVSDRLVEDLLGRGFHGKVITIASMRSNTIFSTTNTIHTSKILFSSKASQAKYLLYLGPVQLF
jgi:hypothetical protein